MRAIILLFVAVLLGANTANGCSGRADDDHEDHTDHDHDHETATEGGNATMAYSMATTNMTMNSTVYERTNLTWSEEACGKKIRSIMPIAGGLDACKQECNTEKNCTAIEYAMSATPNNVTCCVLRKCPSPVPTPNVTQAEWHGGIYDYVGYVKVM